MSKSTSTTDPIDKEAASKSLMQVAIPLGFGSEPTRDQIMAALRALILVSESQGVSLLREFHALQQRS